MTTIPTQADRRSELYLGVCQAPDCWEEAGPLGYCTECQGRTS